MAPFELKRFSILGKKDVYVDEKKGGQVVGQAGEETYTGGTENGRENANGNGNGNENKPPPGYSAMDPLPQVAIEQLNAGFKNLKISSIPQPFPEVDICIAHLKLLEAFQSLKEEVGYTDGAFDLWDTRAPGTDESVAGDQLATKTRNEALSKIREKRWALYVARAVDRFESWWINILTPREGQPIRLRTGDMLTPAFQNFPYTGTPHIYTTSMLPPLGEYNRSAEQNPANTEKMFLWYGTLSC
jgi:hypothetical protein